MGRSITPRVLIKGPSQATRNTKESVTETRKGNCNQLLSVLGLCAFRRASSSAMLGQSIRRFTTSVVRRSHYEEGPGKNLPFSVENKWSLLAKMYLYFGSAFATPFLVI
ncbi:cytochrome c oxidase subunit 7C, mitochondrial-like [Symphalangus syndactylus]|uniref:cytochrome c oxidase subunit 7C, mitochondrial-like n=1 Tax=Symphalangus syndactylus TaxID=9590 RepID=UPI0030044E98